MASSAASRLTGSSRDRSADRSRELPVSLDAALEAMLVAGGIELACDDKRVLELAQLREQPQPLT